MKSCRRARVAAIERGLGLLASHREAALERHLVGCSACAQALRAEELLIEGLAALGRTPRLEVDAAARVLAEIGPVGRIPREDVPAWQLGWAGAAAALGAVVMLVSLAGQWQQIEALLVSGATITSKLLGFADVLVAPVVAVLSFLARLLGVLGETLFDLASRASRLEPFARIAVSLGYGVMASTVVLVLFKDLRRPVTALPSGRN